MQKLFPSLIGKKNNPVTNDNHNEKLVQALLKYMNSLPVGINDNSGSYIHEGFLHNKHVYAIVNFIAQKASGIPWILYEVKQEKHFRSIKSLNTLQQISCPKNLLARKKALTEVTSHPLNDFLENPNPTQGIKEFIEASVGFLALTGETFWHGLGPKEGNNKGVFYNQYVLPSHHIELILSGNYANPVKAYKLDTSFEVEFPAEEITHMKKWNPDYSAHGSWLRGSSPLRAGRKEIQISNKSSEALVKFISTLGAMGIFVRNGEYHGFDEEKAKTLERKLFQRIGGTGNINRTPITSAPIKWEKFGMNPVDLAIIEANEMGLRDICNLYGLNSALFNDPENKVYNNVKEARKSALTDVILPFLDVVRDGFNKKLVKDWNRATNKSFYIDYDIEAIPELQEDLEKLVSQIEKMDYITPNEKRLISGYGELDLPGMDVPWVAGNKVPMASLLMNTEETKQILLSNGIEGYF